MNYEEIFKIVKQANEIQTKSLKEEIKNVVNEVSSKVDSTISEIGNLKKRNITLERKIRRNNIVIFGLETTKQDLLQNTVAQLNTLLGLSIADSDINNIYTVGKTQKPPVILEFVSYLKKQALFLQVGKLKGTGIAITNDLCIEDREEQKILKYHQKKARDQNLEARIKGKKLFIGNKSYSAEELGKIEQVTYSETELEEDEISEESERENEQTTSSKKTTANEKQYSTGHQETNIKKPKKLMYRLEHDNLATTGGINLSTRSHKKIAKN